MRGGAVKVFIRDGQSTSFLCNPRFLVFSGMQRGSGSQYRKVSIVFLNVCNSILNIALMRQYLAKVI